MKPTFTIVTVTYNAESCVEKTVKSVLSQSYVAFEYLVVDGGSKDGTMEIVKKYESKLKWVSEPDKGIYDGMNKAIAMATGEYLLFMNADDTFVSAGVLSNVAASIQDREEKPDVIYGSWSVKTEYGEYHQEPGNLAELDRKWVISHQATFTRTALLKERPFDLQYRFCADFDQLSALYILGKRFKYVPFEIACCPIDSGASFRNFAKSKREHYQIIARRGLGSRIKTELMIFRVGCAHLLKQILPEPVNKWFFGMLAKYYKVM